MTANDSAATATADREIVITRRLNAPRELVFKAWTDREQIGVWWGPRGFTTTTHEMDVRIGGSWRFTMHHAERGNFENLITYTEIVPPQRLVYDHGGDDGKVEFQSIVTFEARGDRTQLTMRGIFPTVEARDHAVREYGAVEGGKQTIARLAELVEGQAGKVLEITRIFDAPRELVFAAWTERDRFVQWAGPNGSTTPFCEIDARPGGLMRFCMRSPDGQEIWCGGQFLEIVPPERISCTDYFTDRDGKIMAPTSYGTSPGWPEEAFVTVTFEDVDGKTKLTLRHFAGAAAQEDIDGADQGWNQSFDKLVAYLAAR
ncbi:MAG TPA: SRPBCC family protein [Dehalococcoidia bacterium]|nr:SRPBCC family protein [Dehalococcoidia bacterium]